NHQLYSYQPEYYSFFLYAPTTTASYTLSLHDALPISNLLKFMRASIKMIGVSNLQSFIASMTQKLTLSDISDESKISESVNFCRSEERFSRNAETDIVCRLLLEKKQIKHNSPSIKL